MLAVALLLNIPLTNTEGNNGMTAQAKTYKASVYRYSAKGEMLIEQGKASQAKTYYQNQVKSNPRDMNAHVGLGSAYSALFQLGAAEKEFKTVLKANPKNPGAHNGMGLLYYRKTTSSNQNLRNKTQDLYQAAINEFKTALRYSPNYPEAHNNLGKIYQEQGNLQDAESEYRNALDLDPNYGTALINLGTIYLAKGEVDSAIANYKQAIKINSSNSNAHYRLGEAYTAQGKYDDAIKELQTALYQNTNSAPVHDQLGEVYSLQGNEAAAITEFNKSITIKPEYSPAYLKLANVYEQRGDDEFAIEKLRSAVNVNPNFTEGKLEIADISNRIGKETQAIKMYQDVLNSDPENVEALKGIASAYYNDAKKESIGGVVAPGDFVEAEQAIIRALQSQPNDLQLHLALLRLNRITGERQAAQDELNIIIARQAQTPAESVARGEALYAMNNFKDGNDEFNRALNYTTQLPDVLLLADIFAENGNLDLANTAYQKALTIDASNAKASKGIDRVKKLGDTSREQYRAGFGFFKEGQRLTAIDDLRKASAANSVDPTTRWLLGEAYNKEGFYLNAIDQYSAFLQLANPADDQKRYKKTQSTVDKLTQKVNKMRANGEAIKDFDQYVQTNKTKY